MEPAVPVELVEHEPEVPVTSGPDLPAAVEAGTAAASAGTAGEAGTAAGTAGGLESRTSVAAGSNGDNLPLLVLHL